MATATRGIFEHVLVPLDLDRGHQRVVRIATSLAHEQRAKLTLLHIIARLKGIPQAELRDFYARLERSAEAKLRAHARRAGKIVDVDVAVRVGDPAEDIVDYAQDNRVGLIVLRSHRVEAARGPKGLGTISYRVAIMARCPVMLVK
jgi:nucleotide-binding universal stress UspA family protein